MNRNVWIAVIAAVVVVAVLVVVARPPQGPAVSINTPNAAVSIGAGGVSISVASSQP